MQLTKSRPVGVSIIAILLGIQGVLELMYGLVALFSVPGFVFGSTTVFVRISPWGLLISGIFALVLAYGLWTLRPWAFWVTVILEGLNLIWGFIILFASYYPWSVLLSMVIPAVILIYFFADSNVRDAFGI